MTTEIILSEVKTHALVPRFYKHGDRDMVEISFVGSKDSISQRVKPEHMAAYRDAWNAYCDGKPLQQRPGTPLTDLQAINEERAKEYIHRNVHNLEELAALNDGQCQSLGHGTLTDRKGARELVARRQLQRRDELDREVQRKSASVGPAAEPSPEIDALKAEMAELKQMLAAALAPKPKGRPKKAKAE